MQPERELQLVYPRRWFIPPIKIGQYDLRGSRISIHRDQYFDDIRHGLQEKGESLRVRTWEEGEHPPRVTYKSNPVRGDGAIVRDEWEWDFSANLLDGAPQEIKDYLSALTLTPQGTLYNERTELYYGDDTLICDRIHYPSGDHEIRLEMESADANHLESWKNALMSTLSDLEPATHSKYEQMMSYLDSRLDPW